MLPILGSLGGEQHFAFAAVAPVREVFHAVQDPRFDHGLFEIACRALSSWFTTMGMGVAAIRSADMARKAEKAAMSPRTIFNRVFMVIRFLKVDGKPFRSRTV